MRTPQVGDWLYASCSAEWWGPIVSVGRDANGADTIDFDVSDLDEFVHFGDLDKAKPPLSTIEIDASGPVRVVFRQVQYKLIDEYPGMLECNTPRGGCYRCCKLFTLVSKHGEYPTGAGE